MFFLLGFSLIQAEQKATLTEKSKVWFTGTSTLHDFECEVKEVDLEMELNFQEPGKIFGAIESSKPKAIIPVKKITCGKDKMDKKMYETLKAENHPKIKFEILSSIAASEEEVDDADYLLKGNLEVSGVKKAIALPVTVDPVSGSQLAIQGKITLKMTDFGVEPPVMMLGALRTGDEIVVHLNLVVKPANVKG